MLSAWLRLFRTKKQNTTITINDHCFNQSACSYIANGSEKWIFTIPGDETSCFIIPYKYSSEEAWVEKITQEKRILDRIISMGIRAQQYELVDIVIEAGNEKYAINGLKTKTLRAVCEEENLVIVDRKSNYDSEVIGILPDLSQVQSLVDEKKGFAKTMFKKIIVEHAIAYAFKLPISLLQSIDDSEHFCFKLDEVPVASYFFWDVYQDSFYFCNSISPVLPTLKQFKAGPGNNDNRNKGIITLVKGVADTLEKIIRFKINKEQEEQVKGKRQEIYKKLHEAKKQGDKFYDDILCELDEIDSFEMPQIIKREKLDDSLLLALDDEFLQDALNEARKVACQHVEKLLLKGVTDEKIFMGLMESIISLGNLNFIGRLLNLFPNYSKLDDEKIDTILKWCLDYEVSDDIHKYFQKKLPKSLVTPYSSSPLVSTLSYFKPARPSTHPLNSSSLTIISPSEAKC